MSQLLAQLNRVPPQSLEAEQSTLGAMLLSRPAIEKALELLQPQDFYRDAHRTIFETISDLTTRDEPADLLTVAEELRTRGQLELVGGPVYLSDLLEAVPTAAHIEYYARIVEQKAILRRLIDASAQVSGWAYEEKDEPGTVLAQAQALLEDLARRHERTLGESRCRFLSTSELLSRPALQPRVGRLLFRNTLVAFYGEPSSGKSFAALDLALSIATGRDWHGHPVASGPVVYVAAEGAAGLLQRVRAWLAENGLEALPPDRALWCPQPVNLFDGAESAAFLADLRALPNPPAVVAFDTLAACGGAMDENSARDMGALLRACRRIIIECGSDCWLIHHSRKDGVSERGHSSLRGAVDTLIRVRRSGGELTLVNSGPDGKQKDASEHPNIALRLVPVSLLNGESSCVLRPLPQSEAARNLSPLKRALLLHLADRLRLEEEVSGPALQRAFAAVPHTSWYETVGQLVFADGCLTVRKIGRSKLYGFTPLGRALAEALKGSPDEPEAGAESPQEGPDFSSEEARSLAESPATLRPKVRPNSTCEGDTPRLSAKVPSDLHKTPSARASLEDARRRNVPESGGSANGQTAALVGDGDWRAGSADGFAGSA